MSSITRIMCGNCPFYSGWRPQTAGGSNLSGTCNRESPTVIVVPNSGNLSLTKNVDYGSPPNPDGSRRSEVSGGYLSVTTTVNSQRPSVEAQDSACEHHPAVSYLYKQWADTYQVDMRELTSLNHVSRKTPMQKRIKISRNLGGKRLPSDT